LGLEQLRELLEREPEQVAQTNDLPDPIDVGLRVVAVLALRALGPLAEQPDLLVVADRPRSHACELGDLADADRPVRSGRHRDLAASGAPASASRSASPPPGSPEAATAGSTAGTAAVASCLGRTAATTAPIIENPNRHHSAVCMLEMKGTSCWLEMWFASPEKTLNRTVLLMPEV